MPLPAETHRSIPVACLLCSCCDEKAEWIFPLGDVGPTAVDVQSFKPAQVEELQKALEAVAADPAWRHNVKVLPPGPRITPRTASAYVAGCREHVCHVVASCWPDGDEPCPKCDIAWPDKP